MTKESTDIQQLVREYRNTRSPAQVSVDFTHARHKSVTANWFTPGRVGLASALSIAALVFVITNMHKQATHIEYHVYPSISLLTDASISLSINTDSLDISDMENMPGLMDISIPNSLKTSDDDQQTKLTEPHSPETIT